ncbi:hypothetical protein SAMN04487949_1207 [Halogranum gelatinilyticum]|uniref:Uncharacterized protein n=1 Tax=Halogranum gelatinilyticum TaxID=660521 RepID=A0A1G9R6L9_9EURY|nr:hypothetical protein [Halogranum gelatinilyticum]SDM18874.1 hypothetical protein SAMN04487949_1207 [Halogranum gelatinilyticum]
MSSRRDDDLVDLLDDLEYTLSDLREELQQRPEARRQLRPPSPGEILRFTDEYTIPTVISILEANIRALELLQKLLRLANPEGSAREATNTARRGVRGVRNVRDDAVDGLDRALSELQRALSEADLPSDPESRDIVEDARSLTDEIERRIEESRSGRSRSRSRSRSRDRSRDYAQSASRRRSQGDGGRSRSGPVEIAVDEESDDGHEVDDSPTSPASEDDSDETEVNVEAELQSIKDDLDEDADDR